MMRTTLSLSIGAIVGGCAASPTGLPVGATQYAFVVLGEEGRAVARVITTSAACPELQLDDISVPMNERARPATLALRPTGNSPSESKPSAFPVLVCEKAIPPSTRSAVASGRVLSLPKAHPRRIVVLGDSGCVIKNSARAFQACNHVVQWPFAAVAAAAADLHPDLVIHVGDYHYRETVCPPGNAGCAGSPWGYGWDAWQADFFAPAQTLLSAAPWIVVRGNHESCNRAGQGWWRLLDPRSLVRAQDCNEAANDEIGDYSEPYAVPLGSRADAEAQLIVFDSSRVGVARLPAGTPMYDTYLAQFEPAFALAERQQDTFFLSHNPVLGLAPNPAKPVAPFPQNRALQSVLETLWPTALFPPNVQALISGHVHLFEAVGFATTQPAQLISGHAGVWLDAALPVQLPEGTTPAPGAVIASLVATNRFGFMTLERDGTKWQIVARTVEGVPMISCTLFERRLNCDPRSAP